MCEGDKYSHRRSFAFHSNTILAPNMGRKDKKLYAGIGARGTVLLRYVTPKVTVDATEEQRLKIVLVGQEKHLIQGGKETTVYTFRQENDGDDRPLLSANCRFVKIVEEGDPSKFFDPKALEKKLRALQSFVEPRVKWKKSKAKQILFTDILEGRVPLDDDPTMNAETILFMHSEYADYDPDKFADRLHSLRLSIKSSNTRAMEDSNAFEIYKAIHADKVSVMSHHGYIEYQGSESQRLLQKDIADGLHISMGKKDLYGLRPEYFNEFPLNVFRDKIYQEIRTGKYVHTCLVKGKLHKSS